MGNTLPNIYRPVANFGAPEMAAYQDELLDNGIKRQQLYPTDGLRVPILGAHDLGTFLGNLGIDPRQIDPVNLADYLEEGLPPTVHDTFQIPAFPFTSLRLNSPKPKTVFFLNGESTIIFRERIAARQLTQQYFGVSEQDALHAWPCLESRGPRLLRANSRGQGDTFRRLLEQRHFLPPQLMLDCVVLDQKPL